MASLGLEAELGIGSIYIFCSTNTIRSITTVVMQFSIPRVTIYPSTRRTSARPRSLERAKHKSAIRIKQTSTETQAEFYMLYKPEYPIAVIWNMPERLSICRSARKPPCIQVFGILTAFVKCLQSKSVVFLCYCCPG